MDASNRRRPAASWLLGALCGVALSASPAFAQSVSFLTYTPSVIPVGTTAPVLVEAEISGTPSSVTIDFNPAGTAATSIVLKDDGTGGDRVAGDRTYAAQLPVAPILAARTSDDVNRVFFGFLNLFSGEIRVFRGNLFIDVYSADVGVYPVTRLSQFVQATSRLVNIHDPAFFLAPNTTARVTQEFYRWFRDDYDVLNIVSDPLRFQNRSHAVIKNRVQGLGLPLSDNAAAYGSGGQLVGISQFPNLNFYDGADNGFIHELGHQWISFLNVQPFAPGVPHWPLSSMAGGVMGISIGGMGGQGGTFACAIVEDSRGIVLNARPGAPAYGDFDLYLMGLMPASEVRNQIVFADQAANPPSCTGQVFTGPVIRVGVNDIISAVGPRNPPYGQAPTRFRLATILVTKNGLATPETMSLLSWMTERAEWRTRVPTHTGFVKESGQPFYVATGGRGTLETDLDLGRPDFALVPTTADAAVTAGASATYSIALSSRQRSFDAPVTLSCGSLPANASCQFQTTAVVPGASGQSSSLTISTRGTAGTTPRGAYVVVVTGRSGEVRHSTAVTLTVQ